MTKDNVIHILAGLIISAIIAIPCYYIPNKLVVGLWASLSGVIAGVVKEWIDKIYYKWDWNDLLHTCYGVVITIIILIIIELI